MRLRGSVIEQIVVGMLVVIATAGCSLVVETVSYRPRQDVTAPDGPVVDGEETEGGDSSDEGIDATTDVAVTDGADADARVDTGRTDAPVDGVARDGSCVPARETCNRVDDDCNGVVDDVPPQVCGNGACRRAVRVVCDGSVATCAPGSPSTEVCNGIDDDCDGMVDEAIPALPRGLGACRCMPTSCNETCTPGEPTDERCGDGVDNDCDGVVDEGCSCDRRVLPGYRIQDAIDSLARTGGGTVCVAANITGGTCSATYTESITMRSNVSVLGGFRPDFLSRRCTTRIDGTVTFGSGVTHATLDGFTIAPGALTSVSDPVAMVQIEGNGTVTNNRIEIPSLSLMTLVGIRVVGMAGSPAPLIARNEIVGPTVPAAQWVFGIQVNSRAAEIRQNTIEIAGSTYATGIALSDAAGASVVDNLIRQRIALRATQTVGILATGNLARTWIVGNTIHGGTGSRASGIAYQCRSMSMEPNHVIRNTIHGGLGNTSVGIEVSDACTVVMTRNTVIGRTQPGGGATGVYCHNSARCIIQRNDRLAGVWSEGAGVGSGGTARGVWVTGGATADVRANAITGCNSSSVEHCYGVFVESAGDDTVVDGNAVSAEYGQNAIGIRLSATNAMVSNNVVMLSGRNNREGIVLDVGTGFRPTQGVVHSNTVVAQSMAEGVALLRLVNSGGMDGSGVIRNNVMACLGSGSNRKAILEEGDGSEADPGVLQNNDLWGCDVLYDNGGNTLNDIREVNALRDIGRVGGNVSVDPRFLSSTDFHLSPMSPLIGAGIAEGAPPFDFDGDLRPGRRGWDIGYDQTP